MMQFGYRSYRIDRIRTLVAIEITVTGNPWVRVTSSHATAFFESSMTKVARE
jgi:hypothetical protein